MKNILTNKTITIVAICSLLALVGLQIVFPWVFALVSIILTTLWIVSRFPLNYATGVVMSTLVFGILGSLLLLITTFLHLSINMQVMNIICSLLLPAILLFMSPRISIPRPAVADEIILLLVLFVPFFMLVQPIIGANSSQTFEIMKIKEDTNSQFQMYRAVNRDGKTAYLNPDNFPIIRSSLRTYPKGSHVAMAVTAAPFTRENRVVDELRVYYVYFAFIYSSMIYFAVCLVVWQIRKTRVNIRLPLLTLVALGLIALLGMGLMPNLFIYGFYGQVYSYACLLLLLYLGVVFTQQIKGDGKTWLKSPEYLWLLGLASLGIVGSWYLLVPLAVPFFLPALIEFAKKRRISIPVLLVLGLLVLILSLFGIVYGIIAPSGAGHILTPGGVLRLPTKLYWFAIPSIVIFGYYLIRRNTTFILWSAVSVIACLFSYAIARYQIAKIGHLDYYFYKSLFTILLISVPLYAATLLRESLINSRNRKWIYSNASAAAISLLAIVVLLLAAGIDYKYTLSDITAYRNNSVFVKSKAQQTTRLNSLLDEGLYKQYSDAIYIGQCDTYLNFMGTIWAGSMFGHYDSMRSDIEWSVLRNDSTLVNQIIKHDKIVQKKYGKGLVIIDEGGCQASVATALKQAGITVVKSKYISN